MNVDHLQRRRGSRFIIRLASRRRSRSRSPAVWVKPIAAAGIQPGAERAATFSGTGFLSLAKWSQGSNLDDTLRGFGFTDVRR